jgi:hypothetical protein
LSLNLLDEELFDRARQLPRKTAFFEALLATSHLLEPSFNIYNLVSRAPLYFHSDLENPPSPCHLVVPLGLARPNPLLPSHSTPTPPPAPQILTLEKEALDRTTKMLLLTIRPVTGPSPSRTNLDPKISHKHGSATAPTTTTTMMHPAKMTKMISTMKRKK